MTYILIAIFSFWFVEITLLPKHFAEWLHRKHIFYKTYEDDDFRATYARRIKPFDCTMCLSFWLALGYCLATCPANFLIVPATSFLAVMLALFTNKYLR